jgi:HEAT repeat protein
MKTKKIKTKKVFKLFLFLCLNILIFLLFYICAVQIIYAESAITGTNAAKKSNDLNEDNNKVKQVNIEKKEITEKEKAETKVNTNEKKTGKKQNIAVEEGYAAEKRKADWIIETIESGTHKDRKNAINQIQTIKDQGLKKNLGEKLVEVIKNEAELEVKVKAITVIGDLKVKEALPILITKLHNEPEEVSVAAVYAIKRIGDSSAKPELITKLKEQKFENNTNLIEALIDTLGEFKAVELSAFASESIKNSKTNQIDRELFVLFLGKIESKESKNTLLELLNDEDENEQIRAFAANSLANLKITEAIPDLEKVVQAIDSYSFSKKRKYNNLYIYCVSSLVKLGYEKAFPMFLNMLRSDNALVRLKAVSLIKDIKDKRTIDILKYKMLYDPSPKVQSTAKEALKELGVDVESAKKDKVKIEQDKKYKSKNEDEQKDKVKDNIENE